MKRFLVILFLFCVLHTEGKLEYKRLAGSPSEFEDHVLPKPSELVTSSIVGSYPLDLGMDDINRAGVVEARLLVDSKESITCTVVTKNPGLVSVVAYPPNSDTPIEPFTKEITSFGIDGNQFPCVSYLWGDVELGEWRFDIMRSDNNRAPALLNRIKAEAGVLRAKSNGYTTDAVLLLSNEGTKTEVEFEYSTLRFVKGEQIGISAFVPGLAAAGKDAVQEEAVLAIRTPSGEVSEIEMVDSGMQRTNDAGVSGPVLTGVFEAKQLGDYQLEVFIEEDEQVGTLRTGNSFVNIVDDTIELPHRKGWSWLLVDPWRIRIAVPVKHTPGNGKNRGEYRAYAEVWSKDSNGNDVAVAWTGGVVKVEHHIGMGDVITLDVDLRWFWRAGVTARHMTLRQLRVHSLEAGSTALVQLGASDADSISVEGPEREPVQWNGYELTVTEEMLRGPMPQHLNFTRSEDAVDNVLLVHGYCAPSNPWPAADFDNAHHFEDKMQGRTHDEFARLVQDFVQEQGLESFGVIGHSQGGCASTHLVTYYWSNVDLFKGERQIQSLATPYLGVKMAGNAAQLGAVLGIGCGAVADMTYEGSAVWVADIPMAIRAKIWAYQVSSPDKAGFGKNYCKLASNAFLGKPNDGVVEQKGATLEGCNQMERTQGQCHTIDMKYPPAPEDHTRNQEMNSFI